MAIHKKRGLLMPFIAVMMVAGGYGIALHAQTPTSTSTTSDASTSTTPSSPNTTPVTTISASATTTPGVPNTGQGGEAPLNLFLLVSLGLLAIGGIAYLVRMDPARK